VFLDIVTNLANVPQHSQTDDGVYYASDQWDPVFTTPHSVPGPDVDFCQVPAPTISLQFSSAPAGVRLYAATGKSCPLLICSPTDRWVLADFSFQNPGGTPVVYCFWGYAGDPKELTTSGSDLLGNVMYMLYTSRP
jgi:hypothetical protein